MHAYLIVAHSEFTILQRLVNSLDDERNDIYIHYDKKVKNVPVISTKKSKLFMCSHRVDVRWGHVSMIKAEYVLLEEAYKKGVYLYYHIISGVHFPLKSQNFLHCFFDSIYDNSVLMEMETTEEEYDSKIKKFNFCIGTYIHKNRFIHTIQLSTQAQTGRIVRHSIKAIDCITRQCFQTMGFLIIMLVNLPGIPTFCIVD